MVKKSEFRHIRKINATPHNVPPSRQIKKMNSFFTHSKKDIFFPKMRSDSRFKAGRMTKNSKFSYRNTTATAIKKPHKTAYRKCLRCRKRIKQHIPAEFTQRDGASRRMFADTFRTSGIKKNRSPLKNANRRSRKR